MMVVMVVQGRAGVRLVTAGQGDKWQLQLHSFNSFQEQH